MTEAEIIITPAPMPWKWKISMWMADKDYPTETYCRTDDVMHAVVKAWAPSLI